MIPDVQEVGGRQLQIADKERGWAQGRQEDVLILFEGSLCFASTNRCKSSLGVCVCAAAKAEVRINFPLKTVEAACQLAEHYPFHGNFHRKMRHGHQTSIQEKGGLVVLYVGDDWRVF